jgi:hypothetical protein
MIVDQEEFKLERAVLHSGDIKKIREYCVKRAPNLLKLSDIALLKIAAESPVWEQIK